MSAGKRKERWERNTSSSNEGKILRILRPSEKRSRTPVKPFIKIIWKIFSPEVFIKTQQPTFSSLVLDAKFARSRKLRVEIGRDETEIDHQLAIRNSTARNPQAEYDGNVVGVGLEFMFGVTRLDTSAEE